MKNALLHFSILILIVAIGCSSIPSIQEEIVRSSHSTEDVNYIPYFLKVYEADSLYLIGEYEKSYTLLDQLFKEYTPMNQDLWYEMDTYINAAVKCHHTENIKPFLINLLENWGIQYEYLDEDIKNLHLLTSDEVKQLSNKYPQNINQELRDSLIEMNYWDQYYRRKGYEEFAQQVDSVEQIHYSFILKKLKEGTQFNTRNVGRRKRKQNPTIGTILIHVANNDADNNYELRDLIYEQVKLGNLHPIDYAAMVDRDLINRNLPQKYFSFEEEVENKDYINKIRREIGLYSLDYMEWRMNQFQ